MSARIIETSKFAIILKTHDTVNSKSRNIEWDESSHMFFDTSSDSNNFLENRVLMFETYKEAEICLNLVLYHKIKFNLDKMPINLKLLNGLVLDFFKYNLDVTKNFTEHEIQKIKTYTIQSRDQYKDLYTENKNVILDCRDIINTLEDIQT